MKSRAAEYRNGALLSLPRPTLERDVTDDWVELTSETDNKRQDPPAEATVRNVPNEEYIEQSIAIAVPVPCCLVQGVSQPSVKCDSETDPAVSVMPVQSEPDYQYLDYPTPLIHAAWVGFSEGTPASLQYSCAQLTWLNSPCHLCFSSKRPESTHEWRGRHATTSLPLVGAPSSWV